MCVVAQQNTVTDLHIIQTHYYYYCYCCCCRSRANHIHMQRKRSLMKEAPIVTWMKSDKWVLNQPYTLDVSERMIIWVTFWLPWKLLLLSCVLCVRYALLHSGCHDSHCYWAVGLYELEIFDKERVFILKQNMLKVRYRLRLKIQWTTEQVIQISQHSDTWNWLVVWCEDEEMSDEGGIVAAWG